MGIIERRLRERQKRVEEIVEAAKRIFSSKGFAAATMNDIADSSELSRRTLYMYFKSKEQLSLAVAASALDYLDGAFKDIASARGEPYEKIGRMLDLYRSLIAEDPGRFQFLVSFAESAKAAEKGDEMLAACEKSLAGIESTVSALLRSGRDGGAFAFPGEPDQVAWNVIFIIHSVAAASISYRDAIDPTKGARMDATVEGALEIVKAFILPR